MDAPTPAPAPREAVSWPVSAQSALVLILTAALFFLLGRTSLERPPLADNHAPAASVRLDLNRATQPELRLLPGVGAALAERIVEYRTQHGPFPSVAGLRHVSGMGPKTLERVRPLLFVASTEIVAVDEEPVVAPKAARAIKPGKVVPVSAIDVNRADLSELQKLPGIGPKLGQRILDERTLRGPFQAVDELRRVSGIGAKTLEKLRPHVTVGPPPPLARTAYND